MPGRILENEVEAAILSGSLTYRRTENLTAIVWLEGGVCAAALERRRPNGRKSWLVKNLSRRRSR